MKKTEETEDDLEKKITEEAQEVIDEILADMYAGGHKTLAKRMHEALKKLEWR